MGTAGLLKAIHCFGAAKRRPEVVLAAYLGAAPEHFQFWRLRLVWGFVKFPRGQ